MSSFPDKFAQSHAGVEIPEPLVRAWDWMEAQGWRAADASGNPIVTPYAGEAQLGPVFSTDLTIEGCLNPDAPGAERLIPIAETDGAGGLALIWMDPDGQPRFVGFPSDGSGPLRLADSAVDFLRLVAIGYDEFLGFNFGAEPYIEDDRNSVEALAEFRAWVESEFNVTVPPLWEVAQDEQSARGSTRSSKPTGSIDLPVSDRAARRRARGLGLTHTALIGDQAGAPITPATTTCVEK